MTSISQSTLIMHLTIPSSSAPVSQLPASRCISFPSRNSLPIYLPDPHLPLPLMHLPFSQLTHFYHLPFLTADTPVPHSLPTVPSSLTTPSFSDYYCTSCLLPQEVYWAATGGDLRPVFVGWISIARDLLHQTCTSLLT